MTAFERQEQEVLAAPNELNLTKASMDRLTSVYETKLTLKRYGIDESTLQIIEDNEKTDEEVRDTLYRF